MKRINYSITKRIVISNFSVIGLILGKYTFSLNFG